MTARRATRPGVGCGLAAIAAAALALRARGAGALAAAGGALPVGDAADHARRALWNAQHAPALLRFDPLLGFPDGAWLPWAPLHAWGVAALVLALGGDEAAVALAARWLPPLLGALATLPVYAAAARLGGRAVGLAAAALFATAPAAVARSGAGELGPSALLALLAAAWLAAALGAAGSGPVARAGAAAADRRARLVSTQIRVTWARTAALLAAPGGLARALVADGAQLAAWAHPGRRADLAAHGLGIAASAALVGLALVASAPGSAREALAGSMACSGVQQGLTAWVAAAGGAAEAGEGAGAGADSGLGRVGVAILGVAALATLVLGLRPRGDRADAPARVLALWIAGFGALSLATGRVADELLAPVAVATAAGVGALARASAGGTRGRLVQAGRIAAVGLAGLAVLAAPEPGRGGTADTVEPAALAAFADAVGTTTPETPGFDDPAAHPADGILAPRALGPALRWWARRAVAGGSAEPCVAADDDTDARRFAGADGEAEALAIAARQGVRYVAVVAPGAPAEGLAAMLLRDGGRSGAPRAERLRRVVEQPNGAGALVLLEIVAGAVIEAPAPPGTRVTARLVLATPSGRRFTERAATLAEDDGVARLRVPYASGSAESGDGGPAIRARGPWRVRVGSVWYDVEVDEGAVRSGAAVPVGGDPGPP